MLIRSGRVLDRTNTSGAGTARTTASFTPATSGPSSPYAHPQLRMPTTVVSGSMAIGTPQACATSHSFQSHPRLDTRLASLDSARLTTWERLECSVVWAWSWAAGRHGIRRSATPWEHLRWGGPVLPARWTGIWGAVRPRGVRPGRSHPAQHRVWRALPDGAAADGG